MRLVSIVVLVAISLTSTVAMAGDADGRYAIKGVGGLQCAVYNDKRKTNAAEVYMYLGWFQGWLSNENRHSAETFDLASWQHTATLLAALDNYCKNNPEHPFVGASDALIASMRAGRLSSQTRLLPVEVDGRKMVIYAETLTRLQNALKQTGDYKGQADGLFDDATEQAIRAFQRREKLPVNGLPDQIILQRLVHQQK